MTINLESHPAPPETSERQSGLIGKLAGKVNNRIMQHSLDNEVPWGHEESVGFDTRGSLARKADLMAQTAGAMMHKAATSTVGSALNTASAYGWKKTTPLRKALVRSGKQYLSAATLPQNHLLSLGHVGLQITKREGRFYNAAKQKSRVILNSVKSGGRTLANSANVKARGVLNSISKSARAAGAATEAVVENAWNVLKNPLPNQMKKSDVSQGRGARFMAERKRKKSGAEKQPKTVPQNKTQKKKKPSRKERREQKKTQKTLKKQEAKRAAVKPAPQTKGSKGKKPLAKKNSQKPATRGHGVIPQ